MKGDRSGALEHMRKYLELVPKAQDTIDVNQNVYTIASLKRRKEAVNALEKGGWSLMDSIGLCFFQDFRKLLM